MDEEKPAWRQMFDAADAELAPRLEAFVRTPEFADAMALMSRLNEQAVSSSNEINRQVLDFWNVASKAEVTDLNRRIATLERQLHLLTKELREARTPSTTSPLQAAAPVIPPTTIADGGSSAP